MSTGSNIQMARKFLNITQKELADKINKTESSVKKYESDTTNVPINVLEDIAKVFNISKETLIGSEDQLRLRLIMKEKDIDIFNKNINNDFYNYIFTYALNDLTETEYKNIYKNFNEYKINHDKPLSKKEKLNNSLIDLTTYANKNTPVVLTERQQDILFDEVIDYIRYKLYSMGK